jgi:endonuclease III
LFKGQDAFHPFTGNADSDTLLNDLDRFPHAFVIGCIMDRQVKAERAWIIPYHFAKALGDFSFETVARLSQARILKIMTTPRPMHRFAEDMSRNFHEAIQVIGTKWGGDASQIWANKPSSAEVVHRFLQFRGVGPKIATMAANILARSLKIPFSDYYSIDVSVDVQVRRVFWRLGLSKRDESVDSITYLARSLHPKFPGLLDSPAWNIGRKWCFETVPNCGECPMSQKRLCPWPNRKLTEDALAIAASVRDHRTGVKGKPAKRVVRELKKRQS